MFLLIFQALRYNNNRGMKFLALKKESGQLDRQAAQAGLEGADLMETAGRRSARRLLEIFPAPRSFVVFCGPGHNGGDGLACAFHLKKAGAGVEVFSAHSANPLFSLKKKRAARRHIKIRDLKEWRPSPGRVLIDALFGVGLNRPLTGIFKELILKIRKSALPVVALDVPSGLCADTGRVLGCAVCAQWSFSFETSKPGFYLGEGPAHSGQVLVLPIGFPKSLVENVCRSVFLAEKRDTAPLLPSYKDTANKSDRGQALIAGGRKGMWGCGLLACRAAFIAGCGYVTWAGADYPYEGSLSLPEVLTARLDDKGLLNNKDAVAVGPGLGFSDRAWAFLQQLRRLARPVVWDADALSLLAEESPLKPLGRNALLTPHTGELSRMIKTPAKDIERDRLYYTRLGAKTYGGFLLLKGFYPVLSDGKACWILPAGNAALGKAGSGDVLTGLLAGLLAQGLSVFESALLGVFLQGGTAERWLAGGRDINSFSAGGIIEGLPFVMKELRRFKADIS